MTFAAADKLGFCWDVNANGAWSSLSNWRRYETLVRADPSDVTFTGSGASQTAWFAQDNAGIRPPAALTFLNYGGGTLQLPTANGTVDSRKCVENLNNNAADLFQIALPRAVSLGVGEKLRLHVQFRVSSSGNMSFGFAGANHTVAYVYITGSTTGTNDEFRTRNGSPQAGAAGTPVGAAFDFSTSVGSSPRQIFFEVERTSAGPDTFTLRFGLNNAGTTSVQTGVTGLSFEDITRVVLGHHGAATSFRIGRVEVRYFPAPANIAKPYVPNWADADAQFEAYWSASRTITVDAVYTVGRLFITSPGTHTLSGAGSLVLESATRDRVELHAMASVNFNVPMTFKKHALVDNVSTGGAAITWNSGLTLSQGATFVGMESALNAAYAFHTSGNSFSGDITVGSGADLRLRDGSVFDGAKTWYLRDPFELTAANSGQRGRVTFGNTISDVVNVPATQTFWMQGGSNGPRLLALAAMPMGAFAATLKLGYAPANSASRGTICDIAVGNSAVSYPWTLTGPVTGPTEPSGNVPRLQAGNANYAPRGGWNRRMEISGTISNGSAGNAAFSVEYDAPAQTTTPTWVPTFVVLTGNNSHSGGGSNAFGYGTAATVVVHGTLIVGHANALGVGVAQMGRSASSLPNNYVAAILANVAATISNPIDITHGGTSGYGVNVFEIGGYGAFASAFSGDISLRGTTSGGTATIAPTHTCLHLHQNGNVIKDITLLTGGGVYTSDPSMSVTAAPVGGRTALIKAQRLGNSSNVACFTLLDPGDYPDGSAPTGTVSGGGAGTQATCAITMTGLGGVCTFSGAVLQNSLPGSSTVIKTGTGKVRLTNAGSDFTSRMIVLQGTLTIGVTVAASGNSAVGNSAGGDLWLGDERTVLTACRAQHFVGSGTYSSTGGAGGTGQLASAPTTVDGVAIAAGDRVLVSHQTDPRQNGIYVVTATTTVWDRATDMDANGDLARGLCVTVTEGTRSAGTRWYLDSSPSSLNTLAPSGMIHFVQDDQVPNRPALLLESGVTFGRGLTVKSTGGFMASATIGADSAGTVTFSGAITLQRALTIAAPGSSTVIVSGVISGAFATDKTGTGDLQLNATHTYTGTTTVSAGRLGGTGSTHASSAVTVVSGASIMGGTGSGDAGTFTVNGDLTFAAAGSKLAVNSTGAAASQVVVGGAVALAGCTVDLNDAMNVGTYDLIVATGTMSGTLPTIGTNNSGRSPALSQVGNTLRLTLT